MTTYIALLRAINVGGSRSLKMVDLRALVSAAGGEAVTTYIQSGNVIFSHEARAPSKLEFDLEHRIQATFGMIVPVIVRTQREWNNLVEDNPFPDAGPKSLHVVLLKERVEKSAFSTINSKEFLPEEFVAHDRHLYLHLPNGIGRAKLPVALERKGPKAAVGTARNWATVLALKALAHAHAKPPDE